MTTKQKPDLPPYMEARPMKRGGYTYRVLAPNGKKVALGWNLEEALKAYAVIRPNETPTQREEELARVLFVRHQKGAKSRGVGFELTLADVIDLVRKAKGRCAVTGKEFSNKKPEGSRIRPWAPSIDRKDAKGGYTVANSRLVCAYVNVAMNQFGDALFLELIEAMIHRVVRQELAAAGIFSRG